MSSSRPKIKPSYKELSRSLNDTLEWFDGSDLDLDEALAKYQQALELIEQMEEYLKTAKNKITKISGTK